MNSSQSSFQGPHERPITTEDEVICPQGFETSIVKQAYGSQNLSAYCIALEGWRRGLELRLESADGVKYQLSDGITSVSFNGSRSANTTPAAIRVVDDKFQTISHLQEAGAPTPQSRIIDTRETKYDALLNIVMDHYKWPVVLKPLRGSRGIGVFANIATAEELRTCYNELVNHHRSKEVLLESHIPGDDYRIYVVGDTVAGACRRIPANVAGDGTSTVETLISAKNSLRSRNPFLSKGLIKYDAEIHDMLSRRGMDLHSVPASGDYVQLRQKANASAGGDVEDVTDEIPQYIKDVAVKSVKAVPGLEAAGVDIIYAAHDESSAEKYAVIELNARAHIGVNMYPTSGIGQNVPRVIVDHYFPNSEYIGGGNIFNVALPISDLLQPLKRNVASSVDAVPIPTHGLPYRKAFTFEGLERVTTAQRRRLTRSSRLLGVSGTFTVAEPSCQLVAGGTEESVQQYIDRAEDILKQNHTSNEDWRGSITVGFRFN